MKPLRNNSKRRSLKTKFFIVFTMITVFVVALICIWTTVYITRINNQLHSALFNRMQRNGYELNDNVLSAELVLENQDKFDYVADVIDGAAEEIPNALTKALAYTLETAPGMKFIVVYNEKNPSSQYVGYSAGDADSGKFYNDENFKTRLEKESDSEGDSVCLFPFSVNADGKIGHVCFSKRMFADGKYYATMVLGYDLSGFFGRLFDSTLKLYPSTVMLNGQVIYETSGAGDAVRGFGGSSKDIQFDGTQIQTVIRKPVDGRVLVSGGFAINDGKYVISYDILPPSDIYQIGLTYLLWYVMCSFFCFAIMLLYMAKTIYKGVMLPLSRLRTEMKIVSSGRFGGVIETRNNDEIGDIIEIFNDMSVKLENYVELNYKQEIYTKDAKLKALQSVINPHFLYNTLDLINWKARKLGDSEIPKMIVNLAKLFEGSMDRSNERVSLLDDELELLRYYLNILDVRFGGNLSVHSDIDTKTLNMYVPKLILQPIVENAVVHGIEKHRGGNIWISSKINSEGDLFVEIENDGDKIESVKQEEISEMLSADTGYLKGSYKIGFLNVHNRIKLICGDEYGLSISNTCRGVKVTVKLRSDIVPEEVLTVSPKLETELIDASTLGND